VLSLIILSLRNETTTIIQLSVMRSANTLRSQQRRPLLLLILILTCNLLAAQTSRVVRGRVTDSKGNPAASVTATVKGSDARTLTDETGSFTIQAPANSTLTFSSVNFDINEVKAAPGELLSVVLNQKVTQLSDVVVVGYGTSSKRNLSSAISTVKPLPFYYINFEPRSHDDTKETLCTSL
jgi:TonB-dependent starch-binding outer membrane protein SusC